MMEAANIYLRYGISLAIGILVGMQREYASGRDGEGDLPAGVRTFALIGVLGCAATHASDLLGSRLPLAACVAALGALLTAMYLSQTRRGRWGLTTEIAALVTFLAGLLASQGHVRLAGALGVVTTLILSLKIELHSFARKLTQEDVFATLKFAVLGVVILPLLPNRSFWSPPFDLINPFQIGLFVVLMLGVEFVGYVLAKLLGPRRGIGLIGVLGGIVSSTAVTLGFTQRSRSEPAHSGSLALAILASWCVMLGRTLTVVSVLNTGLARNIWLPLAASMAAGSGYCLYLFLRPRQGANADSAPFSNPFEMGPALRFGALFVLIQIASRWAQIGFGDLGIYLSSLTGGLMDVDAISFTMARMAGETLDARIAGNAVLLAALANTILKGGMALSLGSSELRRAMLYGTVVIVAAGLLAAWAA